MATYDEGIQAKLESAGGKLEALRVDIRTFIETQRCKICVEKTETGYETRLTSNFDTPPIKWSILIGEIAYHLRSSLDHLVYKLVCENGEKPTKQNAFPIVWELDKVIHIVIYSEKGSEYVKKGREYIDKKALKGVGEQKKREILLNQGFNIHAGEHGAYDISTDPSEFSHLAYLCNVDKHRHLNLVRLELGSLTNGFQSRSRKAGLEGRPLPAIRNTDIEIDAFFHFEKEDDRPSNLGGAVDDKLRGILRAVEITIDYVLGKSTRPFAYFSNQ